MDMHSSWILRVSSMIGIPELSCPPDYSLGTLVPNSISPSRPPVYSSKGKMFFKIVCLSAESGVVSWISSDIHVRAKNIVPFDVCLVRVPCQAESDKLDHTSTK